MGNHRYLAIKNDMRFLQPIYIQPGTQLPNWEELRQK